MNKGKLSGKIEAKRVIYSEDRKTGQLELLTGYLFENEAIVLQVKGKKGIIENNGEKNYSGRRYCGQRSPQ